MVKIFFQGITSEDGHSAFVFDFEKQNAEEGIDWVENSVEEIPWRDSWSMLGGEGTGKFPQILNI